MRRSARPDTVLLRNQVDDLIFFGALGVVLGGRLGYSLFYGWDRLAENPLWFFQVWQGRHVVSRRLDWCATGHVLVCPAAELWTMGGC